MSRGHSHGGWGFAAEKLRFKSVQVGFKVYQFICATAARHLTHELVDRSATGGLDIASGAEFGDGPLLSLAKQDLIYEIAAYVPVVDGEICLQACIVGR